MPDIATIHMLAVGELTPDRIALGRKLYFDTRLSKHQEGCNNRIFCKYLSRTWFGLLG